MCIMLDFWNTIYKIKCLQPNYVLLLFSLWALKSWKFIILCFSFFTFYFLPHSAYYLVRWKSKTETGSLVFFFLIPFYPAVWFCLLFFSIHETEMSLAILQTMVLLGILNKYISLYLLYNEITNYLVYKEVNKFMGFIKVFIFLDDKPPGPSHGK